MSWRSNISNLVKYTFIATVLVVSIGFTTTRQSEKYISDVVIDIDNQFENYFIDEKDILDLVNGEGKDYLLGSDLGSIDLKELEQRIQTHKFVGDVQVFRDVQGVMTIEIQQNRPIARILNIEGEDTYISMDGEFLPESSHYTARVMLISLEEDVLLDEINIKDTEEGEQIFELLEYIDKDDFWKAQIAGIRVKNGYDVELLPQVTKQIVEFGRAEDVEEKFKKLRIFYTRILPYEGWNSYSAVNLKFKKQIVCK